MRTSQHYIGTYLLIFLLHVTQLLDVRDKSTIIFSNFYIYGNLFLQVLKGGFVCNSHKFNQFSLTIFGQIPKLGVFSFQEGHLDGRLSNYKSVKERGKNGEGPRIF